MMHQVMTKEEIKFQCLRVVQGSQIPLTVSAIQNGERGKDIDSLLVDAQKIYDWILKL